MDNSLRFSEFQPSLLASHDQTRTVSTLSNLRADAEPVVASKRSKHSAAQDEAMAFLVRQQILYGATIPVTVPTVIPMSRSCHLPRSTTGSQLGAAALPPSSPQPRCLFWPLVPLLTWLARWHRLRNQRLLLECARARLTSSVG